MTRTVRLFDGERVPSLLPPGSRGTMTIRISLAVEIEYEVDDLVELQAQAVTLGGRPGLNSGDAAMLFLDRAPLTERLTLPGTRATITSLRQERTSAYDPDEG